MSRYVGIHMEHPGAVERGQGATSKALLAVDRGLKSGKHDVIALEENDLIKLLAEASKALAILRGIRTFP